MNQEKRFSDEFLNAFVDNQIAAEEKSRVYIEIGQDEALNRQVCELRKLHDLVQLAYREPPAPPARTTSSSTSHRARLRFGVAASILLTLGIVLGSLIHLPGPTTIATVTVAPDDSAHRVVTSSRQAVLPIAPKNTIVAVAPAQEKLSVLPVTSLLPAPAVTPAALAPVIAQKEIPDNAQTRVLVHLARDDATHLRQALDDIEGLLKYYRETRQNARVEVVVNGGGLELVRTDTSAFAGRIQRLQREYNNLTFAACQNTIDRLADELGTSVQLLPGVITIDSGMAEIMRRQSQGWTYLQV
jgi:intracellular sulfur oxidation DsrE/DsrF family protein